MATTAVKAGQGRAGQRWAVALGWVVVALLLVPGGPVRLGLVGDWLNLEILLCPLLIPLVWFAVTAVRGVELRDGRWLTAVTIAGRRTVDLAELSKVGRFEVKGGVGTPTDRLILRDVHGVRLGVDRLENGDKVDDAVYDLLAPELADHSGGPIAVSHRAALRLRLPGTRVGGGGGEVWAAFRLPVLGIAAVVVLLGMLFLNIVISGTT